MSFGASNAHLLAPHAIRELGLNVFAALPVALVLTNTCPRYAQESALREICGEHKNRQQRNDYERDGEQSLHDRHPMYSARHDDGGSEMAATPRLNR